MYTSKNKYYMIKHMKTHDTGINLRSLANALPKGGKRNTYSRGRTKRKTQRRK